MNAIEKNANAKGSVNETRQWTTQPSNAKANTTAGQHSPTQLSNGSSSPSTTWSSPSGTAHAHANTSATGMANGITYARAGGSCLSLEYASGIAKATSRWTPSASGRAMLKPKPMLNLIPTRCTPDSTDRMTRRRRWDQSTLQMTTTTTKAKTRKWQQARRRPSEAYSAAEPDKLDYPRPLQGREHAWRRVSCTSTPAPHPSLLLPVLLPFPLPNRPHPPVEVQAQTHPPPRSTPQSPSPGAHPASP